MVQLVVAEVQVAPPVAVAVYPEMADPPLEAGADQATPIWPSPGVSTRAVGAPGTPWGVPVALVEAGPAPLALVAVTVTV
jgi:hypothetical protein